MGDVLAVIRAARHGVEQVQQKLMPVVGASDGQQVYVGGPGLYQELTEVDEQLEGAVRELVYGPTAVEGAPAAEQRRALVRLYQAQIALRSQVIDLVDQVREREGATAICTACEPNHPDPACPQCRGTLLRRPPCPRCKGTGVEVPKPGAGVASTACTECKGSTFWPFTVSEAV